MNNLYFALDCLNKFPRSVEGKQLAQNEMLRLKKRIWVTGALAVLAVNIAVLAIVLIPLVGQVFFGAFLAGSLLCAADLYLSFQRRAAIGAKFPDLNKSVVSRVVNNRIMGLSRSDSRIFSRNRFDPVKENTTFGYFLRPDQSDFSENLS